MSVADLNIRQLGPKGDGIHQGARGRVFVDRALPGDRVKARILRDPEGITRAEIVEILEPSPYRQKPPCPHFEGCGNCTLQHLEQGFYRQWKNDLVAEALHKQGIRPQKWLETVFVGSQNRRRATFAAYKSRGKVIMGYYRRRSKQVAEVKSCLVADVKLVALRDAVGRHLGPVLQENIPIDLFLQIVGDSADMVLTGPVGRRGEPDGPVREALERILQSTMVKRISWRGHEREELVPVFRKGPVPARFGSLEVHLPPAAFLQPTVEGEQAIVRAILSALPADRPAAKFADLFSGCGTFSGPLLGKGSVDAFEMVPSSVRALTQAAVGKDLRVFRRDLFRNPLRREELNRYDAIVFDPPRAGCAEQVEQMARAKVPLLIGVSCNPATFARDARILHEGGYRLKTLQVIDQFLWSHHVEMVATFE